MGYKMKGPSLYKPKMADMDIQKNYDKKADDRATSSPYQSNLEDKAKKVIVDTPVSGDDQIKNLEKHKPKNHKTNEDSGSKMHPDKNPACALASVFKNNFSK